MRNKNCVDVSKDNSKVWRYFIKHDTKAECRVLIGAENEGKKICGRAITRAGTTAMWRHLKTHGIDYTSQHDGINNDVSDFHSSSGGVFENVENSLLVGEFSGDSAEVNTKKTTKLKKSR